jgi:hypothetical protein
MKELYDRIRSRHDPRMRLIRLPTRPSVEHEAFQHEALSMSMSVIFLSRIILPTARKLILRGPKTPSTPHFSSQSSDLQISNASFLHSGLEAKSLLLKLGILTELPQEVVEPHAYESDHNMEDLLSDHILERSLSYQRHNQLLWVDGS